MICQTFIVYINHRCIRPWVARGGLEDLDDSPIIKKSPAKRAESRYRQALLRIRFRDYGGARPENRLGTAPASLGMEIDIPGGRGPSQCEEGEI